MPVREILLLGNEQLWQRSEPVTRVESRETQEIIRDLAETLGDFRARKGFGRAIAAPQIGVSRRIILVNTGEPMPLINPVITHASDEMMELWDDCFSFPDLMVRVRRHYEISVTCRDGQGRLQMVNASGSLSELLQHEIDHLDGILAVDRAIDGRSLALRQEIEKLRRCA
ncbi:MAG TPA: peptide deformylase [Blastocatellia bacterium]|nr:peptide deformylase [Blastocatellia bacterium]